MSHPFKSSASMYKAIRLFTILTLCVGSNAYAATEIPHTFTAGNVAKADEVNENFSALATAIDAINGVDGSPDTPNQVREKFFSASSCKGPDVTDVMVKVGPLCVDKYEASVWNETGDTQYGTESPSYPCDPNGNNGSRPSTAIYARSVAGVLPSRFISWFQAQQACAMSGKRLLTNAEWQMAAAGTPDPGETESSPDDCVVNSPLSEETGSRSHCVSNWEVHDMVGNLNEWVADWVQGNNNPWDPSLPGSVTGGDEYGSDHMVGTNEAHFQGSGSHFLAAIYRGGSWTSGAKAGVFALHVDAGPDIRFSDLGFRCAR